jgi:hypothetical protein
MIRSHEGMKSTPVCVRVVLSVFSDNLRDHYPTCSQRRNRQIPEAARGGRRSHACDSVRFQSVTLNGQVF